MYSLQTFDFEKHEVRTMLINDEPWFVGKDVASVLGYADTNKAIAMHVDNDMDEEDHDTMRKVLNDIAEDLEEELRKQFEAIRIAKLLKSLRELGEVLDDEDDDAVN